MGTVDYQELLQMAREKYKQSEFSAVETILQKLILNSQKTPEILTMLGTISYDKGKFNQAISYYKQALEMDPTYSEASVGLSVIYNDLGKYDEGKEVFQKAKSLLDKKTVSQDPYVSKIFSQKHEELGDLYFQHKDFDEALVQYYRAQKLNDNRYPELTLKISDCFIQKKDLPKAVKELTLGAQDFPQAISLRLKLGVILYNSKKISEAIREWERILLRDPSHPEALKYIHIAKKNQNHFEGRI